MEITDMPELEKLGCEIENKLEKGGQVDKLSNNEQLFVNKLIADSKAGILYNKVRLEKEAGYFGIYDQNDTKELAELSIALLARAVALSTPDDRQAYDKIVQIYEKQVNLSHRTSQSMLLQQYSTPAPIGFLSGVYCKLRPEPIPVVIGGGMLNGKFVVEFSDGSKFESQYQDEHQAIIEAAQWMGEMYHPTERILFEPSAGNGLLTIAVNPSSVVVNEIDPVRNRNLRYQRYREVLKQDASLPFSGMEKKFDAVITNPPFGAVDDSLKVDGFEIKSLEMIMAIRALDTMKDSGRAAIIIGGHTSYDDKGRIQAGKNRLFFVYLYKHYNVEDVINIDGHALYSRQGTAFDIRLILINGRKKEPGGFPPLVTGKMSMTDTNSPVAVDKFDALYDRVKKLL
jgi:hypothetical protein